MSEEKLTKEQREFLQIRETLKEFNENELKRSRTKYTLKIDYEYIYDIQNMETTDYDISLGRQVIRKLNDAEMRAELAKYAQESFNIRLNPSRTFSNMIKALTNEVQKINSEEDDVDIQRDEIVKTDDTLYSPADLLNAYEIATGVIESQNKPKPETLKALSNATINMSTLDKKQGGSGCGKMVKLTQEEVDTIFDPDFVLGC